MSRQMSYKKRGLIRRSARDCYIKVLPLIAEGGTTTTVLSYKDMPLLSTVNSINYSADFGSKIDGGRDSPEIIWEMRFPPKIEGKIPIPLHPRL